MNIIFSAFKDEALPFISILNLKKDRSNCWISSDNQWQLWITGGGKENTLFTLNNLVSKDALTEASLILNFGAAATNNKEDIGKLFLINAVSSCNLEQKVLLNIFPELCFINIRPLFTSETPLISPGQLPQNISLGDMEAFWIVSAMPSKSLSKVIILKIATDCCQPRSFTRERFHSFINANKDKLHKVIGFFT